MRADRLLSIVLLLQHRGRMSATAIARELEVSTRTVLRDVEALSAAGIPVYAERGRTGGFALLPGFTTDLTGLTHDEALALLVAGSSDALGMSSALTSAMRKVVAALRARNRDQATRDAGRVLVSSDGWRPRTDPTDSHDVLGVVRGAVFAGRRLRLRYAARDEEPRWRTVDPVGLVRTRGAWYLLASRDGADRTYRVSRMLDARELPEQADRPDDVDLGRIWREHRDRFAAATTHVVVRVRVRAHRRAELVERAAAVLVEEPAADGSLVVDARFADQEHAVNVLWSLAPDVEALAPADVRARLAERAAAVTAAHGRPPVPEPVSPRSAAPEAHVAGLNRATAAVRVP